METVIPRGDQVLVERVVEKKTKGGILIPESAQKTPTIVAARGKVLAVGPGKADEHGKRTPIDGVKVGDTVSYHTYPNGVEVQIDGRECYLIAERQIVGVFVG